jgi:selenocysteine lyase/cysteine desulfurase
MDGDYYAVEIMNRIGRGEHGMVRVGPVHYNTIEEIDWLILRLTSLVG